jgi:hypothetical protein
VHKEETLQLSPKRIIDVFLSSEATADIVLLFRRNPMLIDYGDHIASRIGRKGECIERDLKKLAKLGVLDAQKIGKKTWFGFDAKRDRQVQKIITNYIRSCAESPRQNS